MVAKAYNKTAPPLLNRTAALQAGEEELHQEVVSGWNAITKESLKQRRKMGVFERIEEDRDRLIAGGLNPQSSTLNPQI